MYLLDTSVWIDLFKAAPNPGVERLKALLTTTDPGIGVTTIILQEILQRTADDRQCVWCRSDFETHPIYLPQDPILTAITFARIYFDCRRCGVSVRSSNVGEGRTHISF